MFKAANMLFIYTETPMHAGTGRGLGGIDLPIQRERVTKYPIVQASGLKGRLRAEARRRINDASAEDERDDGELSTAEFEAIFGPEPGTAQVSEFAGALALGDARLLLFPVRSLAGVFAWTTSTEVLARFLRDADILGLSLDWDVPDEPAPGEAFIFGDQLEANDRVVLEEFTFIPTQVEQVKMIGQWLAKRALPAGAPYRPWREMLPTRLAVLHRDTFRDFTTFATEVVTRVQLDSGTKTVAEGGLWTEEYLPVDTLLYAPLTASDPRNKAELDANSILQKVQQLKFNRIVLGGDETIGRGIVALRFINGGGNE